MNTDATPTPQRPRTRLAIAIATALGVGYIPKAPGTFGSVVGVLVAFVSGIFWILLGMLTAIAALRGSLSGASFVGFDVPRVAGHPAPWLLPLPSVLVFFGIAWLGVWSASRVTQHTGVKDPQMVVIDEVSGQHLTYLLTLVPIALPAHILQNADFAGYAVYLALSFLNWKYLVLGFILFRVFDIWKPYPVRQLERLPGGWGIMADDWMAGIYAALVLRLALHFSLV